MKKILVTGATGFIGSAVCRGLAIEHSVLGIDKKRKSHDPDTFDVETVDLADEPSVNAIFKKFRPDAVVHCAAIAHQKIGSISKASYFKVNSTTTENLAKAAYNLNPKVKFIFLSSVSVYGEGRYDFPVTETHSCFPTSDYGKSKQDAEKRLINLASTGRLENLFIFRLAPVYDMAWSLNIDRRIFSPRKLIYLKFGSGEQKMSVLARSNLVDFIKFTLRRGFRRDEIPIIINVCDGKDYAFNEVINVFRKSETQPSRPVVRVPLFMVFVATRLAGFFIPGKREWIHASYEKLASNMIFDNTKMLKTGFKPKHNLETVYLNKRN